MSDGKLIAGLCLKVPLCSEDMSSLFSYTEKIRADGFQAGAASRDAEVARLKNVPMRYRRMAFNAQLQDEVARLEQENDQLRAQINVLREALSKMHDTYFKTDEDEELCKMALASTPEQSITEYRNKVIEDVERYRWLRGYMASERTDLDDEIVEACSTDKPEKLDAFIDTAIRAMNEQP